MLAIKKIVVAILTLESKFILRRYKPFVVAVTGSVGKTATKDAVFSVLKGFKPSGSVRKSEKNFNNELGLPLTIIGASTALRSLSGWIKNIVQGLGLIFDHADYPTCLILEVGADHPGDIKRAARLLRPNIAVITRVSATPVHVEFFSSPEEVFEEKASLAEAVRKGGTVVLYADDAKVMSISERVKDHGVSIVSFGTVEGATVRGSDYAVVYEDVVGPDGVTFGRVPTGFSFAIGLAMTSYPVSVKDIIGATGMYPLLAAAAVGLARGMSPADIVKGIGDYEAPRGRMNVIAGIAGSTLLDDTYNSSPDAARAALQSLASLEGRKIAVLGDMMELGSYSNEEHRTVGREAASLLGADGILIAVGLRSRATAEEALAAGMSPDRVLSFGSSDEAATALPALIKAGDVVLIKGSQSPRLERVTKALLREPARAGDLLVRQEKEWLEKK